MNKIFAATAFAILGSATTLPAQWLYIERSVERDPMTDEIVREKLDRASIRFSVEGAERGVIWLTVRCLASGSTRLEFLFTKSYDGPNLLGVRAGESLRVRFRFDEQPATDWQTWKMHALHGDLRGVRVIPAEGPLSIDALRRSGRMLVEVENPRTRKSRMISDINALHGALTRSNVAIGRLECVP